MFEYSQRSITKEYDKGYEGIEWASSKTKDIGAEYATQNNQEESSEDIETWGDRREEIN